MESVLIDQEHPLISGRTGRGVRVAVIDSGVNPDHDHIGGVVGGVALADDLSEGDDYLDRLGHGTAVTAAIHEKAPGAEILAVRVFQNKLATRASVLVRAIEWAAEHGSRLINLSLGTTNAAHAQRLHGALSRAAELGSLVVSAGEEEDERWLPGSLGKDVVAAALDWECPRHALRLIHDVAGSPVLSASGYPRPIPGVPVERNLWGLSFAVANVTGMLALALEAKPEVRTAEELHRLLG